MRTSSTRQITHTTADTRTMTAVPTQPREGRIEVVPQEISDRVFAACALSGADFGLRR